MDKNLFNNSLIEAIEQLPNSEDLLASLDRAFQLAQERLQSFASDPDFDTKMRLAFGEEIDVIALGQAWALGDFSVIPAIEVRPSAEINGANGAYAATTNTIYLAQELLEQNAGNPEAVAEVLLEEVGHAVDQVVNESDSAGDEGAIFARLVQGETLTEDELRQLRAENDVATVVLDGQTVEIEQEFVESPDNPFYKYKTIVKTGDLGLQDLSNRPSINDLGQVAVIGDFDTTAFGSEGIIVGDGSQDSLKNIAPGSNNSSNNLGTPQINNEGKVIVSNTQSNGTSGIRLYDSKSTDDFLPIATGGGDTFPETLLSPYPENEDFHSVFVASVNNNNQSVFIANKEKVGTTVDIEFQPVFDPFLGFILQPVPVTKFFWTLGDPQLVTPKPPQPPLITSFNELPFELPLTTTQNVRPVIADNGDVVVKLGNQANSPILLYDNALKNKIEVSSGFSVTGSSPGISDDGRLVAFYGNESSLGLGEGIFLTFVGGNPVTTPIALKNQITLPDGFQIGGELSGFDVNSPVAVNATLDPKFGQRAVTVAYTGFDKGGNKGLYTTRVNLFGDQMNPFKNPFNPNAPAVIRPSSPTLVAE